MTVIVPITGIEVPETLTLGLGGTETEELNASVQPDNATGVTLTYESSDETVATVDANEVVTAVGVGECVITTRAAGTEVEAETKVTVEIAVTGITLSANSGSLYIGNSANMQVYTSPQEAAAANAEEVTYTSSDESVATAVGTTEGAAGFTVKGLCTGQQSSQ